MNLGSGDMVLARRQAQFSVDNMPGGSIKAIEIGNEPDVYRFNGRRSNSYAFPDYLRDYSEWQIALQPILAPNLKLMGPSWAIPGSLKDLPAFLDAQSQNLLIVSQHWYAGKSFGGRSNTPDYLLHPDSATSGAREMASSVKLAHKRGLLFRVGEMNSIACDGEAGVSDTFASALWVVDALFELAKVGVDGVNIHGDPYDVYGPFLFDVDANTTPRRFRIKVIRPEYYGLVFFQQAAPAGSKLLPIEISVAPSLKCWATVDDKGAVRIVVINKDTRSPRNIEVNMKDYAAGSLVRLLAASYEAKSGVTLGGKTLDGSANRTFGTFTDEKTSPRDGVYRFPVPASSVALLTLERSQSSDVGQPSYKIATPQ